MSKYPIPQIAEITRLNRKIGLGVMGWADLLILLGIAYDSEEAIKLAEEVMGFISREALEASIELARHAGRFRDGIRRASIATAEQAGSLRSQPTQRHCDDRRANRDDQLDCKLFERDRADLLDRLSGGCRLNPSG